PAVGEIAAQMAAGTSFCTAILIGCETVLTAAHCVCADETDTYATCVASGLVDPQKIGFFFQHIGRIGARSVSIHPQYSSPASSGDVAIIKLATPVSGITPARLATAEHTAPGTSGTVVGFGRTSGNTFPTGLGIKRVAPVVTVRCPDYIPGAHICGNAFQTTDGGGCQGDSGGPLFVGSATRPSVAGMP